MEILLEKIGIINLRYEKLKAEHDFNIFSILRNGADEVHVHSNFIQELLNPIGSHRKEKEFLEKFLETAGIEGFDTAEAQVYKEQSKIDVLIHNRDQAIIIENKIWARDQDKQLERYYQKTRNRFSDIWIIYLTLHGDEPSENSIGNLPNEVKENRLFILSYSFQISKWIDECIAICARQPILRETLIQYKNLIEGLTGKSMSSEQRKEVIDLLSKNDNILKAQVIAENWVHTKWHTEWYFWTELEEIIEKEYTILPDGKYSSAKLDNVVHGKRNRNYWYGIMFRLFNNGEDDFCLFIERGDVDVYYGVTVVNNKGRNENKHVEYSDFADKLNEFSEWGKNEFWLGGNWLYPRINFEAFSGEDTLRLINKEYRQQYLRSNWKGIKEFIRKVDQIR